MSMFTTHEKQIKYKIAEKKDCKNFDVSNMINMFNKFLLENIAINSIIRLISSKAML